jgi:hypothetical protein
MITPYIAQPPIDDFSMRPASLKFNAVLAVSTDTALTVPGDASNFMALIKCTQPGDPVWFSVNSPASAPAGASLAATNSELCDVIRMCRQVKAGDVLHFFTTASNVSISVSLYAYLTNN